jgi:hypothetical protein
LSAPRLIAYEPGREHLLNATRALIAYEPGREHLLDAILIQCSIGKS